MITQHHCAVLLNKETFEPRYTCTPVQVPSLAVLGHRGHVTDKCRRAPTLSCSYLTAAHVHINDECADLSVLPCCSWCGTCASSSERLYEPATSTKKPIVKLSQAIFVSVVFRHPRSPSAMPAILGPLLALRRCGALAPQREAPTKQNSSTVLNSLGEIQ